MVDTLVSRLCCCCAALDRLTLTGSQFAFSIIFHSCPVGVPRSAHGISAPLPHPWTLPTPQVTHSGTSCPRPAATSSEQGRLLPLSAGASPARAEGSCHLRSKCTMKLRKLSIGAPHLCRPLPESRTSFVTLT